MPPKRTTTTTTPMTDAAIKVLIAQGVGIALAEYKAHRGSGNGDDRHDSGSGRRTERATRECTYSDILKCQPFNFKGTEGVVGLTQWFEEMESVFHISNSIVACQIKFATCTLQGNALTWWNSHVKTVSHEVAYGMTWKTLKKMMTDKYYPRGEIKKLEIKLWNLKVKGIDVLSYNQHFQELALMCGRMFPVESDEVEKYVGGLPDMIQGSVMASNPKTMQDAIEFPTELVDQKIQTFADRQAEKKESLMTTQEITRINSILSKGKMWQGPTLLGLGRKKCMEDLNLCAPNETTITMGSVLPSATTVRRLAFWPVIAEVHLLLLTTREPPWRIRGLSLVLNVEFRGITRRIALRKTQKPMSLRLVKYHAVIICDENIIHIPLENEILIVRGDKSNNGHESRLNIISCTKTQKYLLKGCDVFLAHVTTKKAEDKLKEKRIEDVPIVRDFSEVFPEDLLARAPYRLAPSEMKELSNQLQELSDK
ncbi:putative reverse transcriptase domain-containing protein, partial [Tanacetum coccineum]